MKVPKKNILKPLRFWFEHYLAEHNLIYKCILTFKERDNKTREKQKLFFIKPYYIF